MATTTTKRRGLWAAIVGLGALLMAGCAGLGALLMVAATGGGLAALLIASWWLMPEPTPAPVTFETVVSIPCEGPSTAWPEWRGDDMGDVLVLDYPAYYSEMDFLFRIEGVAPEMLEDGASPLGSARACIRKDAGHEGELVPWSCLDGMDHDADDDCPNVKVIAEVHRD